MVKKVTGVRYARHRKASLPHASAGFTLIEVLVAAIILFMVVATAMLSYQTAMRGSQRSAQLLELLSVSEAVQHHIKQAIRDNVEDGASGQLEGRSTILGVEVNWRAEPVNSAPPPARFDPETEGDSDYAPRFYQYQVIVTLTSYDIERQYSYLELAWHRSVERL